MRLKDFECNECDYGNPKLGALKDHYKTNHWNKITTTEKPIDKTKTKSSIPEKNVELKKVPEEVDDKEELLEQVPKSISSENNLEDFQDFKKSSNLEKNEEENSK